MRQARGAAYVAVEVYEWIQYAAARRERQRSSSEFRRLARDVARKAFGGTADGLWPYYEAMEEKSSSGRFYFSSDGALVPEMDTSTWNGSVWDKARQLFFVPGAPDPARTDPRYRSALAYYDSVAVHDGFLWDWSNNQLSWNLYKSAVARKNQETRLMNRAIAVIVVNHLVSGIDGLATVRLRRSTGARGEERYEVIVPWAPLGRPRSRGR